MGDDDRAPKGVEVRVMKLILPTCNWKRSIKLNVPTNKTFQSVETMLTAVNSININIKMATTVLHI